MGINTYFAFHLVGTLKYSWESALGLGFIVALLQIVVVFFGIRKEVILALPEYYRIGLAGIIFDTSGIIFPVGIGLLLALVGVQFMRLVETTPIGFEMADITWRLAVGLCSVLLISGLIIRNIRIAFLATILMATVLVVVIEASIGDLDLRKFEQLSLGPTIFKLSFEFNFKAFYIIPVMLISHLFDSIATVLVLLRQAYFSQQKITLKGEDISSSLSTSSKVRTVLMIDACFALLASVLGTSSTTSFIESAAGISAGARTGLSSMVEGLLFLLSIPIGPIVEKISQEAVGASLLITACLLISFLKNLDFDNWAHTFPAVITILTIPFTSSIVFNSLKYS